MPNMVNGSAQSKLSRFFQVIHNQTFTKESVTPAAFSKARKKFSYSVFKDLNSCVLKSIYQSDLIDHWHGFRLLAVDGSITAIPSNPELDDYFGKTQNYASHPSARLSQLYDVVNKVSVDVQVAPFSDSERTLAIKHFDHMVENDLVLYDRGYTATWLFILHQQKDINFCTRTTRHSNVIRKFL